MLTPFYQIFYVALTSVSDMTFTSPLRFLYACSGTLPQQHDLLVFFSDIVWKSVGLPWAHYNSSLSALQLWSLRKISQISKKHFPCQNPDSRAGFSTEAMHFQEKKAKQNGFWMGFRGPSHKTYWACGREWKRAKGTKSGATVFPLMCYLTNVIKPETTFGINASKCVKTIISGEKLCYFDLYKFGHMPLVLVSNTVDFNQQLKDITNQLMECQHQTVYICHSRQQLITEINITTQGSELYSIWTKNKDGFLKPNWRTSI